MEKERTPSANPNVSRVVIGLDIGSVSVKTAVVEMSGECIDDRYLRHKGYPLLTAKQLLGDVLKEFSFRRVAAIVTTGSGGKLVSDILGIDFVNEVIAQARAAVWLKTDVRTVVEMGGEDSKLILLRHDPRTGMAVIDDFSMNTVCAAGTGSFLDQQASRMGVSIEDEFGALALRSARPPRIAGRCSVFAKSDMIHLQQIGTPDYDIIAGLCYAVARSFKSNVGKGKVVTPPVLFHGGVAANNGVVRAFREVYGLGEEDLIVPPRHEATGAIGAALYAIENNICNSSSFRGVEAFDRYFTKRQKEPAGLEKLRDDSPEESERAAVTPLPVEGDLSVEAYIGIDTGSLSTNVVAIDAEGRVLSRRYLKTAGRPLEAVARGLREVGEEVGGRVRVCGVGTTGSGRYLTGDYVGADTVRNEITAQATAAIHLDPTVDTIFEIGGQDSKYISIDNGTVVDFEMNKVCAAGTGSFLEEQAEKLGITIEEEFGTLALQADNPGRFGDRCTVFMESDVVSHQQRGMSKRNLVAGLAYSIAHNYLNKVVGDRRIGDRIFFQGGVASNKSVVAAFERVTGKKIVVPPHHDVTGAIGAALLAQHECRGRGGDRFKGFDLSKRTYETSSFTCNGCDNLCEIRRVTFGSEHPLFYGARCERYERDDRKQNAEKLPDYFTERERLLLDAFPDESSKTLNSRRYYPPPGSTGFSTKNPVPRPGGKPGSRGVAPPQGGDGVCNKTVTGYWFLVSRMCEKCIPFVHASSLTTGTIGTTSCGRVGIPRVLHFHEFFPYWRAFFTHLGYEVILSETTTPHIIHAAAETVATDTCFPVKIVYGHVQALLEEQLDYLFLPSVISMTRIEPRMEKSYTCPLVQALPYILKEALPTEGKIPIVLRPPLRYLRGKRNVEAALVTMGREMGCRTKQVREAIHCAEEAQQEFYQACIRRGREVIAGLEDGAHAVVLLGRPYNTYDAGINLNLPKKLRDLGALPIPQDFLDLSGTGIHDRFPNMYWRYGQRLLGSAEVVRNDPRLHAICISNFKCGPDSFIEHFFRREMEGKPYLQLEIDEHSADAGVITRCEAFLDSVGHYRGKPQGERWRFHMMSLENGRIVYVPQMAPHAHALSAAIRAFGVPSEVLPESDERTLELGRQFASGRECLPFLTTTGDIVKKLLDPSTDHRKAAFFIPTAHGPCRFGQYAQMHRMILDNLGLSHVPLVSPVSNEAYSFNFGALDTDFRRLLWRGLLAVDILEKLAREHRPYETEPGTVDELFSRSLGTIVRAVERGGEEVFAALKEVGDAFRSLRINRENGRKPIIGVVGEIYIRTNRFANNRVVEAIERLGGEAWVAPLTEWIFYTNNRFLEESVSRGKYGEFVKGYLKDMIQKRDEERMLALFEGMLTNLHEPSVEKILNLATPYLHHSFGGEAILSIGTAIDYLGKGASGIINVMPFTCMPGMVTTTLARRLRHDFNNIPWLNITCDGQKTVNDTLPLEAFMHQACQYRYSLSPGN